MPLTLTIVEPAVLEPSFETKKVLVQGSLTIGRPDPEDPECSALQRDSVWILPDESKRVSRCEHCRIFCEDNLYFIIDDRSVNGTFLNGRRIPQGKPEKLQHGNQIRLCDNPPVYEIWVSMQKLEEGAKRKVPPWTRDIDNGAPGGARKQSNRPPFENPPKSPFKPKQRGKKAKNNNDNLNNREPHEAKISKTLTINQAMRSFATNAGLKTEAIDDLPAEAFFSLLGQAFREAIIGVVELLEAREVEKQNLKIPCTTEIGGLKTNPLKAIIHEELRKEDKVNHAIILLLNRQDARHLNAQEALKEAFLDIKAHEWATLKGVNAGLTRLLERFDPKNLGQEIQVRSGLRNLWQNHKKANQWDAYIQLYDEIAKEARHDFQKLFQGRFQEAYEETVKKFKRD